MASAVTQGNEGIETQAEGIVIGVPTAKVGRVACFESAADNSVHGKTMDVDEIKPVQGVVLGVATSDNVPVALEPAKTTSRCWRWRLTICLGLSALALAAGIGIGLAVLGGNSTPSMLNDAVDDDVMDEAMVRGELLLSVEDAAAFVRHASSKLAIATTIAGLHDAITIDNVEIERLRIADPKLLRGQGRRLASEPVLADFTVTLALEGDELAAELNVMNTSEVSANLADAMEQASLHFQVSVVSIKARPSKGKKNGKGTGKSHGHDEHDGKGAIGKHREKQEHNHWGKKGDTIKHDKEFWTGEHHHENSTWQDGHGNGSLMEDNRGSGKGGKGGQGWERWERQ